MINLRCSSHQYLEFIVLGFRFVIVLLLSAFILAGCTLPKATTTDNQQPSATLTPAPPNTTPTPTITPTITPSPTPTLPEMYTYPFAGPVPEGAIRRIGKGVYYGYALSPDGYTIAVASSLGIYLYSAQNFQLLNFYGIGEVYSIRYSPDGSNLIAHTKDISVIPSTNILQFINASNGAITRTIQLTDGAYYDKITIAPDGNLMAASYAYDPGIEIWDIETGMNVHYFSESVWMTVFSPDGKYLVATTSHYPNNGNVLIWDIANWNLVRTLETNRVIWDAAHISGYHEAFEYLAFSPDGTTLAVGASAGSITFFDTQNWMKLEHLAVPQKSISLGYSPEGKYLASISSGESRDPETYTFLGYETVINLWDTATLELVSSASYPVGNNYDYRWNTIPAVQFLPDGSAFISDVEENVISTWSMPELSAQRILTDFSWSAYGGAFTPGSDYLFSGDALWEVATGKLILEYTECNPDLMSPDGKFLVSNKHPIQKNLSIEKITVCDTYSGEILHSLDIPDHATQYQFSPDGQLFGASLSNSTAVIWDTETWEILYTLTGHSDRVNSVAFSPDGKTIATGSSDTTIRLWDAEGGDYITTLKGFTRGASDVSFSHDGSFLIGGEYDFRNAVGKYIVFDVVNQTALLEITDAWSFQFSLDGKKLGFRLIDNDDWHKYWRYYDTTDWSEIENGNPDDSEYIQPGGKPTITYEGGTIVIWPFQN